MFIKLTKPFLRVWVVLLNKFVDVLPVILACDDQMGEQILIQVQVETSWAWTRA